MLLKTKSTILLSLCLLLVLSITFQSCNEQEPISPQDQEVKQSIFQKHLADNTQLIQADDLGEGQYAVTGEQGTIIEINDALVNAAGDRVRGTVEIKLIEIYTFADVIMNRKQTLADYNGTIKPLESGGELFVKVYQNGEELKLDGQGTMTLLFPTSNTGGAKEGMELFYGEEVGAQIIWKPTGEKLQIIENEFLREDSYYMMMLESTLGWVNVDVVSEIGGSTMECIEVLIECDFCEWNMENSVVALDMTDVVYNGGFELTYRGGNSFRVCEQVDGYSLALGGINVNFIVIIECENGTIYSAVVNVNLNAPSHTEMIKCDQLQETNEEELIDLLSQL